MLVNFDSFTALADESVFKLEQMQKMPYSDDPNTLSNIMIEVNRDLMVLQRDGYTFLDLISDIGGI